MLINITIPVYNEEAQVAASVEKVVHFVRNDCTQNFDVVIADNASTDRTLSLANEVAQHFPEVRVMHLDAKGRGRALRQVWMESTADILSYMDVDLSTDLEFFPALLEPLIAGRSDLGVGSRLQKASKTRRGLKREIVSRGYNLLAKWMFGTRFSDAQCGFKAITRRAAFELLPLVEDHAWFFDTELLLLAERLSYRIHDLPVRWVDDPDSRVKLLNASVASLKGLLRMRRKFRHNAPACRAAATQESAKERPAG